MSTTTTTSQIVFASRTQDERIAFYKASTAAIKDPTNKSDIDNTLIDLAKDAEKAERSFRNIRDRFDSFSRTFPEVRIYALQWHLIYWKWRISLQQSKNYASATADYYRGDLAAVVLTLVSKVNLRDEADVKIQVERLERFARDIEHPPVEVPANYEDAFTNLTYEIENFKDEFLKVIERMGKGLSDEIKVLKTELEGLEEELRRLNKQVDDWTIALAATSWIGFIGALVAGIGLGVATRQRNDKAREVEQKAAQLAKANERQGQWEQMGTAFSILDGDFKAISSGLVQLSRIWSDMRSMSFQLITAINNAARYQGKYEEEFWLALENAIAVAQPLADSLIAYATHVHIFTGTL